MWIIPFLLLGVIVGVSASRGRSPSRTPVRALPPTAAPGPIVVLGEFARVGRVPPPQLIMCALAEAETCGLDHVAHEIVRIYIEPVVRAHDIANARDANPEPGTSQGPVGMRDGRGYGPYDSGYYEGANGEALPFGPNGERLSAEYDFTPHPDGSYYPLLEPRASIQAETAAPQAAAPQTSAGPRDVHSLSDAELQAMLDRDPAGFQNAVKRGVIDMSAAPAPQQYMQPEAPPVVGVAVGAWSEFCDRLERDDPNHDSNRHVGRYRQNKDRLRELGIDPATIAGNPDAQRAALEMDLGDAYHHADGGGVISKHVGRRIALPGEEGLHEITRSGVLGVIQAAGLENAVGWLESSGDRRKFQHTTNAFRRANGVF